MFNIKTNNIEIKPINLNNININLKNEKQIVKTARNNRRFYRRTKRINKKIIERIKVGIRRIIRIEYIFSFTKIFKSKKI